MVARLVLLRHGETDWNRQDRYQGRTDVHLNDEGRRQARSAAAGPVGQLLEDAEAVVAVSSPLARARETAQIVLEASVGAVELDLDPHLAELHGGDWEGLELAEIATRWPDAHAAWRASPSLDAGPTGGETMRAGGERLLHALELRVAGLREEDHGFGATMLAVAHGGVLRAAVGLMLGLDVAGFARLERIGNAKAVVFEADPAGEAALPGRTDETSRWRLAGYNV